MEKLDSNKLEARFKEFCKNLSKEDKVAIIHHSDADGICSAVITGKAIEKLTGNKPVVVRPYEYGNRSQVRKATELMKKEKVNKAIFVDIGIDGAPHGLEDFCPFEKCLVIDHHKMYKDLNDEKVVFLKSQFFTDMDSSNYVASKFAFDLFGKVTDMEEFDWLACVGILGDMSFKAWKDFVKKTIEKRNVSMTWLYRFLDLIASVEVVAKDRLPELYWELYDAKNPADVLESSFQKYLKIFKEEKDSLVEEFDKKSEKFPKIELCIYPFRAKHENIKSYVINEISEMKPNKTIILIQYLETGIVRFSARRQDGKVKVNDLLTEAVKGIPRGSAGGHAPAAAGSVPRQHLSKFKKNVVTILEKQYEK